MDQSVIRPGVEILRHSTSHVMAQAVQGLFPGGQDDHRPGHKEGFYYDFDFDRAFSPEDLPAIEKKMKEIVDRDLPIIRRVVSREEAIRIFRERGEPYKVELIEDTSGSAGLPLPAGEFIDLCRGPHVPSTGRSRPSNSSAWPGLTGGGMSGIRCSRGSTEPPFPGRKPWRITLSAGGGSSAGPPKTGKGARPLLHQRGSRSRAGHLPSQGCAAAHDPGRFRKAGAPEAGIPDRHRPPDSKAGPLETLRPLRELPGQNVFHRSGRAGIRNQADELPGPHADLQIEDPQLPGPSPPLFRTGNGPSP